MGYIYSPKGKAGEYADYALNLYNGCSHGCKYCYAPLYMKRDKGVFHGNVQPRKIDMRVLRKEMFGHSGKELFLCFTCDPYQPMEKEMEITRRVLEECREFSIHPIILSKGGMLGARDFDILSDIPGSMYGITVTLLNEKERSLWEPGAASSEERIEALKEAHDRGISTWISIEPVIDPEQSLEVILKCHSFTDTFKVGKMNNHWKEEDINWTDFATRAVELLQSLDADYYIKDDLRKFLR